MEPGDLADPVDVVEALEAVVIVPVDGIAQEPGFRKAAACVVGPRIRGRKRGLAPVSGALGS